MSVEIKEGGDADIYTIMQDGDWLGVIRINGKFTVEQQRAIMNTFKAALEGNQ